MKCIAPTVVDVPEDAELKIVIVDWRGDAFKKFGLPYNEKGTELTGTEKDVVRIVGELIALGCNVQVTRIGRDHEDKKLHKEHKRNFYWHSPAITEGYMIGVDYYRFQQC